MENGRDDDFAELALISLVQIAADFGLLRSQQLAADVRVVVFLNRHIVVMNRQIIFRVGQMFVRQTRMIRIMTDGSHQQAEDIERM